MAEQQNGSENGCIVFRYTDSIRLCLAVTKKAGARVVCRMFRPPSSRRQIITPIELDHLYIGCDQYLRHNPPKSVSGWEGVKNRAQGLFFRLHFLNQGIDISQGRLRVQESVLVFFKDVEDFFSALNDWLVLNGE